MDEVLAEAESSGALGSSTDRFLDFATRQLQLPEGAEWRTVRIKYYR